MDDNDNLARELAPEQAVTSEGQHATKARRSRRKTTTEPQLVAGAVQQVVETAEAAGATDFDPEKLERESAAVRQNGDEGQQGEGSHAAAVGKKKFTPPQNPFPFEGIAGKGNRVHLLKSEPERQDQNGAWVIRFDQPPNEMEGYSKDNPHPVIAYLKSEGHRWGFDHDGKGGWGKEWQGDPYGADHIEARRVLQKAAEMVGAQVSQGQAVSA